MRSFVSWKTVIIVALLLRVYLAEEVIAALERPEKTKEPQKAIRFLSSKKSGGNFGGNKTTTISETKTISNGFLKNVPFTVSFDDPEEDLTDFSYQTIWHNGSVTFTNFSVHDLDRFNSGNRSETQHVLGDDSVIGEPELLSSSLEESYQNFSRTFEKRRFKRIIFGRDGRIRLNTSTLAQKFPFSPYVKIAAGSFECSGSLISPFHVLTSAHCVHDGQRPLTDMANLRVGVLRRNGKFRWIRVVKVNFPESWRRNSDSSNFDYAVIKLIKPHKRPFFKLGVINRAGPQYKIHFASFPGDKKSNTMWYSHCNTRANANLLICRCDAARGSSGAGTYVRTKLKGSGKDRVIVGVLSGSGIVKLPDGKKHFNFVTKLTTSKARQICRWIGRGSNCVTWNSFDASNQARLRSDR